MYNILKTILFTWSLSTSVPDLCTIIYLSFYSFQVACYIASLEFSSLNQMDEMKAFKDERKNKFIPALTLCRLTHTLLQRTLYSKGTLCNVTSCSKEQFASYWLVTVFSLTHFTPQHTLPPGMFFSSAQFASQHSLLPKTPCSSTHFASQHTRLLRTLCSSAHFASKNTLLLGTLYSSTHFAS